MRVPTEIQIGVNDLRPNVPTWLPPALVRELDGRLWHATDEFGFRGIISHGQITALAKAKYQNGFCRGIGAVSLFDLSYPDPPPPIAHWSQWISRSLEAPSFWLEIDREKSISQIISPEALLERWRRENSIEKMRIIAGIESAHVGPIPLISVSRVLVIQGSVWSVLDI